MKSNYLIKRTQHRTMKPVYLLCFLFLSLFSKLSFAHSASDSYLTLSQEKDSLNIQWDIALLDLEYALGLDNNNDGDISAQELKTNKEKISAYALSHLSIINNAKQSQATEKNLDSLFNNNSACSLDTKNYNITERNQRPYLSMNITSDCQVRQSLAIDYQLFKDIDPSHKGIITLTLFDQQEVRILDSEQPSLFISNTNNSIIAEPQSYLSVFIDFIIEGIWHIWIGLDHILFLFTLLLPAALIVKSGKWAPEPNAKKVMGSIIKLVTAFTIAHSITLSLSVFGIFSLPAQWVESVIAISIIIVAINNIKPLFSHSRLLFAFGFGLIHGFGFANVLLDLSLQQSVLALSILAFNIGVELGQVVIIAAFLPIIYYFRYHLSYRRFILPSASLCTAGIAAIWTVERIGGYTFLG